RRFREGVSAKIPEISKIAKSSKRIDRAGWAIAFLRGAGVSPAILQDRCGRDRLCGPTYGMLSGNCHPERSEGSQPSARRDPSLRGFVVSANNRSAEATLLSCLCDLCDR